MSCRGRKTLSMKTHETDQVADRRSIAIGCAIRCGRDIARRQGSWEYGRGPSSSKIKRRSGGNTGRRIHGGNRCRINCDIARSVADDCTQNHIAGGRGRAGTHWIVVQIQRRRILKRDGTFDRTRIGADKTEGTRHAGGNPGSAKRACRWVHRRAKNTRGAAI